MKKDFIVIGIDDNREQWFAPEVREAIASHHVFSGGRRHHEIVRDALPEMYEWIDITVPIDAVFRKYDAIDETIVVFASGDPLFFGFANTIKRMIPDAQITLYPSFNSLQMLAHRMVLPYHDMKIVSLTGRPWQELDAALIQGEKKIGVLTDGMHTPSAIAARMLHYGFSNFEMIVGEHLGNRERERVTTFHLEDALHQEFERPNCIILYQAPSQPPPRGSRWGPGIPDHLFQGLEGRPKMITKAGIRVLTLSALELQHRKSFWDIGFCTGSVSIEARLMFSHLRVTAFEVRPEGRELMETNAVRFHAPGIQAFIADFLDVDVSALKDEEGHPIPMPDAIFIGGHGGRLRDVMVKAHACLQEGGVMVYNCVDPASVTDERIRSDSEEIFNKTASQLGMEVLKPLSVTVDDYHPIKILKARKKPHPQPLSKGRGE